MSTGEQMAEFVLLWDRVQRACLSGWPRSSVALLGCNTTCLRGWPVRERGPWDEKALLFPGSCSGRGSATAGGDLKVATGGDLMAGIGGGMQKLWRCRAASPTLPPPAPRHPPHGAGG
jgi:hypothetical protein